MTQDLSNEDFAERMRRQRGESPPERRARAKSLGSNLRELTRVFVDANGDLARWGARDGNIDPDHYQPLGSKIPWRVPPGKFHNQRVYHWKRTDNSLVLFGSAVYDSCEEAYDAIKTEPYVEHRDLATAELLTIITVKQGVLDLSEAMAAGDVKFTDGPFR